MSTPLPLPVRILVKGPSTVLWTSMMGGPRTDLAFPRVIEKELLAKGRPAVVRNTGLLGWPTKDLFKTWDDEIVGWSPDIVILAVGHYEILHTILPRWLERGANTVNRRPGRWNHFFYRRLLRGTARLVIHVQKRVDRPGRKLNKRRMRRALVDTAAYIKMIQQVGSPMVMVMEIHPPSASKVGWFGGWPERTATLNEGLRRVVADADRPNVRFVEITDLMDKFDRNEPAQQWADGIHFSPAFHAAIGEKFAGIADEWASTQPHLASP